MIGCAEGTRNKFAALTVQRNKLGSAERDNLGCAERDNRYKGTKGTSPLLPRSVRDASRGGVARLGLADTGPVSF